LRRFLTRHLHRYVRRRKLRRGDVHDRSGLRGRVHFDTRLDRDTRRFAVQESEREQRAAEYEAAAEYECAFAVLR